LFLSFPPPLFFPPIGQKEILWRASSGPSVSLVKRRGSSCLDFLCPEVTWLLATAPSCSRSSADPPVHRNRVRILSSFFHVLTFRPCSPKGEVLLRFGLLTYAWLSPLLLPFFPSLLLARLFPVVLSNSLASPIAAMFFNHLFLVRLQRHPTPDTSSSGELHYPPSRPVEFQFFGLLFFFFLSSTGALLNGRCCGLGANLFFSLDDFVF